MAPLILLVDDQRDILRLLHSALDALAIPELEILEASSSEAAKQSIIDRSVDLLVADHNLPGLNGLELAKSARAVLPGLRIILITGHADRNVRDQMMSAGALAVFSKPVPLGDFLAAVERGLGLRETILPEAPAAATPAVALQVSELFANFLQATNVDALFLITNRGRIVERAGDLKDRSMEVSLISAATAAFAAGLKVAESNRQDAPNQFAVFSEGDQDLILMPVDPLYALLVAGNGLAAKQALSGTLEAVTRLKADVALSSKAPPGDATRPIQRERAAASKPKQELDAVLDSAAAQGITREELDAFWDAAASKQSGKPMSKDVLSYEQARKLGLTPDSDKE